MLGYLPFSVTLLMVGLLSGLGTLLGIGLLRIHGTLMVAWGAIVLWHAVVCWVTRYLRADHRNIQHMVRYTELSPDRFKAFGADSDNTSD